MRVALVTGCAHGIGREVAANLLREEWEVYGLDLEHGPFLPGLKVSIGDVTSEEILNQLAFTLRTGPGHLNALVNCAGLVAAGVERPFPSLSEIRFSDMLQMFRVNTWGPVLTCQVFADLLRQGAIEGAAIVNVVSDIVYQGCACQLPYIASKGALHAVTRALAKELGSGNIRVNGVAPGLCLTQRAMASPVLQAASEFVRESRPINRDLHPKEVADAILYLLGPLASGITGQILPVNLGQVFN